MPRDFPLFFVYYLPSFCRLDSKVSATHTPRTLGPRTVYNMNNMCNTFVHFFLQVKITERTNNWLWCRRAWGQFLVSVPSVLAHKTLAVGWSLTPTGLRAHLVSCVNRTLNHWDYVYSARLKSNLWTSPIAFCGPDVHSGGCCLRSECGYHVQEESLWGQWLVNWDVTCLAWLNGLAFANCSLKLQRLILIFLLFFFLPESFRCQPKATPQGSFTWSIRMKGTMELKKMFKFPA